MSRDHDVTLAARGRIAVDGTRGVRRVYDDGNGELEVDIGRDEGLLGLNGYEISRRISPAVESRGGDGWLRWRLVAVAERGNETKPVPASVMPG